jgi:hypothetical protein
VKPICVSCKSTFSILRRKAGYTLCMPCGEKDSIRQRARWCVVQEYGKGGYQLVTPEAAVKTLRETNQKSVRS